MATTILQHNLGLKELVAYHHLTIILSVAGLTTLLYQIYKRKASIYLLDFACFRPPNSYRFPFSMFFEHVSLDHRLDPDSVAFQIKILERSGYSSETYVPPSQSELPIGKSFAAAQQEAETVVFTVVANLLKQNNIKPKNIDILISNSSMFSPTPSICTMIVNKFRMRSNVKSFNLSGMGCSAGIVSVGLAKDLLRVHRNSLALIVSTETLHLNWYTGKNHSMLLSNCLFRMGGAAILMSSRDQDKKAAKYELQHLVRTTIAQDDNSYACVYQDVDSEEKLGVSISKGIASVAAEALKTNVASLGPLVLPYSEQFRYGLSVICHKLRISGRTNLYIPNFKRAFKHFCVHAGGRSIIQAIEKSLRLSKEDVEGSIMTLHRFGNTSSSSVWYELSYIESKGRMRKGDSVWQIGLGSGFKCNSAVWKCVYDIEPKIDSVWRDCIDSYPVNTHDFTKSAV